MPTKRIYVRDLAPGRALDAPLYDAEGKLLLAEGQILTQEMRAALQRSNVKHLYLGDPSFGGHPLGRAFVPLSKQRDAADEMSGALVSRVETSLADRPILKAVPAQDPFDRLVDNSIQGPRSAARVREWEATIADGAALVEDITNGSVDGEGVAEAATGVVSRLMNCFAEDRSLLNHLISVKGDQNYLFAHAQHASVLALNIAAGMQLGRSQLQEVGVSALLHNIGMTMLPESLVNARRNLSKEEFTAIQRHIPLGLYVLDKFSGLPRTTPLVVYQHKERSDGSGYPAGRTKHRIHTYAQIVAVADVYDALTAERPWRRAYHPYRAMEQLIREASQKFDPEVVRGLLRYLSLFPIGSLVRLSTGEVAKVLHSNVDAFDRPVVGVLLDSEGNPHKTPIEKDLLVEQDLHIESVIEEPIDIPSEVGF